MPTAHSRATDEGQYAFIGQTRWASKAAGCEGSIPLKAGGIRLPAAVHRPAAAAGCKWVLLLLASKVQRPADRGPAASQLVLGGGRVRGLSRRRWRCGLAAGCGCGAAAQQPLLHQAVHALREVLGVVEQVARLEERSLEQRRRDLKVRGSGGQRQRRQGLRQRAIVAKGVMVSTR